MGHAPLECSVEKSEQGINKIFKILLLKEKVKKMTDSQSVFTSPIHKHDVDIFLLE